MKKNTVLNIIFLTLLLLFTARFIIAGWNRILLNSNSADGDQPAFLQLGLDARDHGLITDGKRMPFYPIVLATFAEREWRYFTWAKIVNLGVGLITIWAVYLIGRRLFNPVTGLAAACLLSVNIEFIFHSSFVLAESFLILFIVLAWWAMVRALQSPQQGRYWVAAGALAGLAYLTKGTGPLIVISFVITATLLYRQHLWRQRGIWYFLAAFGLVALPLWLYNWWTFGSPIFNSAINNVMWMDDASEKYVADASKMPTLATYWQEKSLAEAWNRLWQGLLVMRYFFVRLLWPTRTLAFDDWFQAGRIDGLVALATLILLACWRWVFPAVKRQRESLLLTTVLVIIFYILFGWYIAISPFPIRFILPLAPMLYLLLAAGVVSLVRRLFTAPKMPQWAKLGMALVIALLLLQPVGWFVVTGWLIARDSAKDAFAADAKFNETIDQSLLWTQTGHAAVEAVTVMWGPTHQLPIWKHTDRLNLLRTPVAETQTREQLEKFMAATNVAYVIVDDEMLDRMNSDLSAAWGLYRTGDGRVEIKNFPADWALGFTGPALPCQWCVFRRLSASPPLKSANFELGQAIRLFGYDLQADPFRPGSQVVVTLYWAAQQTAPADYTVFTQLLGPDAQLHGQMDRPPLLGQWPTSQWQPGQKFMDKFVLKVSEPAPTGAYTLLVGLYDAQTGQRLPVKVNGERVQDDAIPLVRLTMN